MFNARYLLRQGIRTRQVLVCPYAAAVPELPRHGHAEARVGMRQHGQVEVRAVAPNAALVVTEPLGQRIEHVGQELLGLVEYGLRFPALPKPLFSHSGHLTQ